MKSFVDRIVVSDAASRAQLLTIWDEVRQGGLTEEYLVNFIDQMEQTLDQSQQLNFTRWPIMNKKVHQNPKLWGSYEAEVKNVKDYLARRIAWMDKKLKYNAQDFENSLAKLADAGPQPEIHVWNRRVFISGIPGGTPYTVLSTQGTREAQGISGEEGPLLTPGIHIISINGQSRKILVR
jgi:hypothetical protein